MDNYRQTFIFPRHSKEVAYTNSQQLGLHSFIRPAKFKTEKNPSMAQGRSVQIPPPAIGRGRVGFLKGYGPWLVDYPLLKATRPIIYGQQELYLMG